MYSLKNLSLNWGAEVVPQSSSRESSNFYWVLKLGILGDYFAFENSSTVN